MYKFNKWIERQLDDNFEKIDYDFEINNKRDILIKMTYKESKKRK